MNDTKSDDSNIEKTIAEYIASNGGAIRNKAALGALVKIIPGFGEGLYHALTAGGEAVKEQKIQLQLDLLCQLVEKIDCSISEMLAEAKAQGADFIEVSGEINVCGENTQNITGVDIASGRSASIKPGTVVNVTGKNATHVTGVKV